MELFFAFSGLFNALTSTLLALFVYLKNKESNVNKTFAFFCFCVAIWSYAYIFWPLARDAESTLFWFRILHLGAIYVSVVLLHFIVTWLGISKKKRKIVLIGYSFSTFFAIFAFSPLFIKEVVPKFSLRYWANPGILYHFYLALFFGYAFYALYLLSSAYRHSTGVRRLQIRYILIGMIITYIGGSTNYFLWYNINIPPYLNIFASAYVVFIAYSITRFQLMDIRLVIRKSMVYAAMAVFTYGFFYFGVWFLKRLFGSVYAPGAFITTGFLTIIALALFFLFERFVNYVADRYFFSSLHNQHETLKNFSKELTTIIDLEKLLSNVCGVIKKTLDLDKVAIISRDFSSDAFKAKKIMGFEKEAVNSFVRNVEMNFIFGKNPRPIVYEELEVKKFFHCKKNMEFIGAYLLLPLVSKDKLQGIIIAGRKNSGDAFSQEDIRLLEILSHQAALAIENAMLYDRLQNFNELLEEKVNEQTKDIKAKNAKLRRLLDMKTEFLRIASHQLRTPVSAIKGLVSMLEDGDFDDADMETKKRVFNGIFRKTEKMTNVLDDILTATELDTVENFRLGKDELMDMDIDEMTRKVINDLKFDAQEKNISVIYSSAALEYKMVKSNERDLRHILVNLLSNAIAYTRSDGRAEITVSNDAKTGKIRWEIKDNGIGIPKNSRIFEKFKRCSNAIDLNRDGSGLGLFIVKKLVDAHPGGEMGFTSKEGDGSTFWVKLPVG